MPLRDATLPCATVSVRGLLREGGKPQSENPTQKRGHKSGRQGGRQTDRTGKREDCGGQALLRDENAAMLTVDRCSSWRQVMM